MQEMNNLMHHLYIFSYFSILGRPVLVENLSCLTTQCLEDQKELFYENLEPFVVADLLFEEYDLPVSVHDKITEANNRRNQTRHLLETLAKNSDDSFHSFLDILQRKEEYQFICEELRNMDTTSVKENMSSKTNSAQKHEIVRESGNKSNVYLVETFSIYCVLRKIYRNLDKNLSERQF